jgi:hypothetical protein
VSFDTAALLVITSEVFTQIWRNGKISFVRLTDQTGTVSFFTERFTVGLDLVHEYVQGTIFTKPGLLKFYHHGRVVRIYRYRVNKT